MSTKMLPGCMSAWKKLCRNTCVKKISTPFSASRRISVPASRRRAMLEICTPRMRSMTMTRGPAEIPMHRRHVQQRRVLEIAAQLRGVACFAHQVELIENGFLVFAHHFHGLQAAAAFPVRFGDARQLAQHLEIARDDGVHAGPQDLDHDFAGLRAIERDFRAQLGGVHLRDGRGGQRCFLENREHLFGGAAIRAFDDGARHLAVERRHAILQLGEFVGDVDGQQVAPRGQRLAKLHEDRSQLLEREAQTFGARRIAATHRPGPGRQQEQEAQRAIQMSGAHEFVQPVTHQHALYFDEAGQDAQFHRGISSSGVLQQAALALRRDRGLRAAVRRRGRNPRLRRAAPGRRVRARGTRPRCERRSAPARRPKPVAMRTRRSAWWAGVSPMSLESSSSTSGLSSMASSRNFCATSASPRMVTSPRWMTSSGCESGERGEIHQAAGDFGVRRLRASWIPLVSRIEVFSDSATSTQPSPRASMRTRLPTSAAAQLARTRAARQVSIQQILDRLGQHLVTIAAMHGDDATREVVVAAVLEPRVAQHA